MKTNKILTLAMIMAFSGAAFTSCAIKDNEKTAEQVEDPIKATTEYYINGKVVDEKGKAVQGVALSAGEKMTATSDANGIFSITVGEKKIFTISASKDGYLNSSKEVSIPTNAENRATAATSFILTKKSAEVTVPSNIDKTFVVASSSNEIKDNLNQVETGIAVSVPQESASAVAGKKISVTEYVSDTETNDNEVSVANVYVETSENIEANGFTIAIANPVRDSNKAFSTMNVYKNSASSRSNETLVGTATLINGKYQVKLTGNEKLAGDYSFKVAYTASTSNSTEQIVSDKKENLEMAAIRDFKFSYKEKAGWEYVNKNQLPSDATMNKLVSTAINAKNGAEGVTESTRTLTTNISGESILYYTAINNVTKSKFTFKLNDGSNLNIETKAYTGSSLKYTINPVGQHSGGTGE